MNPALREPAARPAGDKLFPVSWDQFHRDARALAWRLSGAGPFEVIVTITRGGLVPAAIVARELGIRVIETISISSYRDKAQGELSVLKAIAAEILARESGVLVVDDLVDTGATARDRPRSLTPRAFRHGLCEAAGAAARRHVHHRGVAGHLDLFPLGFGAHLPAAAVAGGGVRGCARCRRGRSAFKTTEGQELLL